MPIQKKLEQIYNLLSDVIKQEDREAFLNFDAIQGATPEEIQQFEKDFDITFTPEIRHLFMCKNGSGYPLQIFYTYYAECDPSPYYFMSLEEIRKTKEYFCSQDKTLDELKEYFEEEDLKEWDERIVPYLFNKKWIPFAQMVGGSLYLMFDFTPTAKGKPGQVIIYVHDPDFIYFVADSISSLLDETIENLEDGWYEEYH